MKPARRNPGSAPRLRRLAIGVALYCCAVAVGIGSAWVVLRKVTWSHTVVQVGAWTGSTLTGSPDADIYTRARVALGGLLALGRDETMYYIATQDDAGRPLRSHCTYRVEGQPPTARWWSITAYADDYFLFDAPNKQYSLNGTTAQLDNRGQFVLSTGPAAQPGIHWLPTPGNRGVVLTLRLYNPTPDLQAAPSKLQAPRVNAIGACQ
jgi:hypothetical protein